MASKKAVKRVEMTLWDVVLSFPDLANPKPFKGKVYYKTDCLLGEDHPQLGKLRAAMKQVRVANWGEDKSEWPEKARKKFVLDGNEREDQKVYHGQFYISASTQTPVPVVDLKGKAFNAQMVKGGMTANVAICISPWENDGEEGMSIYLQGVQVDTTKDKLPGFGGGKSVKQMFGLDADEDEDEDEDDSDSDEDSDSDSDDDEDDTPRGKKKKPARDEDEDSDDDDSDSDSDDDDEDEKPAPKKKKKPSRNFDEDDE